MPAKKFFNYTLYVLLFLNLFFLSTILSFQITLKGEMINLPDLIGKTMEEAKSELAQKKINIVQSGVRLHERYERGRIIYQDPQANSKVKLNTDVMVVLSAGKEKVIVPELVGKNLQTIGSILDQTGLRKGKISHVHTPKYAAGKIIGQFPLPNEEVGRDTPISFLVSQGQLEIRYLMPDLIGKGATNVIAQLKNMDFNVGNIRYRYYRGLDSGIIINQSPAPGSKIQKRNRITLEVSK
jgi:beta-lactam-binding protein with PASTA domain